MKFVLITNLYDLFYFKPEYFTFNRSSKSKYSLCAAGKSSAAKTGLKALFILKQVQVIHV